MAKKSTKEGASKSDLTRQYVAKNPGAGPKDIVAGLKAEGVEISAALASKIKYDKSRKGGGKKARLKAGRVTARAASSDSERGNKAEAIRQAAKSLGKKVRPRDIIAMLKEQGIEVSSAQVSTTLKAMGMRRTRRGRKPASGGTGASHAASRSEPITLEDLIAAKKLVNQLGSAEAASRALSALARLS